MATQSNNQTEYNSKLQYEVASVFTFPLTSVGFIDWFLFELDHLEYLAQLAQDQNGSTQLWQRRDKNSKL
jgi:hypothetical protein